MIVKVQVSVFDSRNESRVLIYNKSRSVRLEFATTKELSDLMRGREKAYFHAQFVGRKLQIDKEAPWQAW